MQDLLQQLDDAVAEVFTLLLSRACAPAPVCLPSDTGLTASVAFSGSMKGVCMLHLDLRSAVELTEELIGEPLGSSSVLPADTVAELCNMVAGSWKSRLEPHRAACLLSSPTVTEGPLEPIRGGRAVLRSYRINKHCLILKLQFA